MNRHLAFAFFCLLATAVTAQPATSDDEVDNLQVTGRGVASMARNFWTFLFGEDDYDYDYDQAFSPNEDVSSYTFYNPNSARRESYDLTEGEDEYSWGEFAFGAALAIVPIGLLMAAFPAGLFTVAVKKRSFNDDNLLTNIDPTEMPLLKSLQEGDLLSIVRPQCQQKLFCELSQLGKDDTASFLQRTFYYVAHLTPENISRRLRLQRLFDATRANQCERFSCHNTQNTSADSPSNHLSPPTNDKDAE